MLFLWPGTSNLLRGQGTYVSDPEIDKITEVCSTGEQNFVHELVNIKVKEEDEEGDDATPKKLENRDPLYKQAITIVVQEQRGSCSLLQRAMGIGYGRAARLIDFMAEDGYVGQYNGSKAREVMLSEEQWSNIQNGDPNPVNDDDWPEEETDTPAAVAPPLKPKSKPATQIDVAATEVDEEDSQGGEIEVTHPKSPSRVRRPKLKSLRKDLGKSSHIAANSAAAPESEKLEDETIDEEFEEIEDDELEYEDAESSAEDDAEYEYEDGDYDEDEEFDEEDYDEDDYEDVD